jgi:hypothetical protein
VGNELGPREDSEYDAVATREGGGYYSASDSRLFNSIIWDSTPNDLSGVPIEVVSYSDSGDPAFLAGEGNLVADPQF